MDFTEVFG